MSTLNARRAIALMEAKNRQATRYAAKLDVRRAAKLVARHAAKLRNKKRLADKRVAKLSARAINTRLGWVKAGVSDLRRSEYFVALWRGQDGRCAICEEPFKNESAAFLDHCHDTNTIRGLLCRHCNAAEGFIKATGLKPWEWYKRLQDYLNSPPFHKLYGGFKE